MTPEDKAIFDKLAELLGPFNEKGVELKPETEIAVDLAIDSVSVMACGVLSPLQPIYPISNPVCHLYVW